MYCINTKKNILENTIFNHILVQYNLFWVLRNALHATESFTRTLAY